MINLYPVFSLMMRECRLEGGVGGELLNTKKAQVIGPRVLCSH